MSIIADNTRDTLKAPCTILDEKNIHSTPQELDSIYYPPTKRKVIASSRTTKINFLRGAHFAQQPLSIGRGNPVRRRFLHTRTIYKQT